MEVDTGNSCFIKKLPVERYTSTRETKKPPETNKSTPVFVNHVPRAMEVDSGNSYFIEKLPVERYTSTRETKKPPETNKSAPAFVNHAAVAWHENRRKWVGEASNKSERMQKDPIISWSTTYEDLLSTTDPFSERIPLTEMVDFLVDIWHVEGLFD